MGRARREKRFEQEGQLCPEGNNRVRELASVQVYVLRSVNTIHAAFRTTSKKASSLDKKARLPLWAFVKDREGCGAAVWLFGPLEIANELLLFMARRAPLAKRTASPKPTEDKRGQNTSLSSPISGQAGCRRSA